MKIGFIGLGNMGAPMAANLAGAGHQVRGYDLLPVAVTGVEFVAQLADAARAQDVLITMLPNGQILRDVYAQIVPQADSGSLLLDCSTVDVDSARAAHQLAQDRGLLSVDAPVSGGIGGATAGTLTFMAGGTPEAFAQAEPLFDIMGQKAVHCGDAGAGQSAKICNNMILGISMIAVGEAFTLAGQLGLAPDKLFDVVSTSSGACWSMNTYCPVPGVGPASPADNEYRPGFAAELMLKDLLLSQAAAQAAGTPTPLGQAATDLYQAFVQQGGEGQDFSAIMKMLPTLMRG